MSVDFNRYLDSTPYLFYQHSLDRLQEQSSDIVGSNGILLHPRKQGDLLSDLTAVALKAAEEQTHVLKPTILLDGDEFRIPANCTDTASAILQLASLLGLRAYGQFNGWHANIVVPADEGACWVLDEYKKPHLQYIHTEISCDRWPGVVVPNPLKDGEATGILFLKHHLKRQHSAYMLNSDNILGETTTLLEAHPPLDGMEGFMIARKDIALPMFRALDVLRTLRLKPIVGERSQQITDEAKGEIKSYIPRLKPSASDRVQ